MVIGSEGVGWLRRDREDRAVSEAIDTLHVRTLNPSQPIGQLSGGNQQKVAIARLLHHDSGIFFLDEPTRGLDVGSKAEIYRHIMKLAKSGRSIIFVSSYLPELLGVCDTLAVMHRGGMIDIKAVSEWDEDSVMRYAAAG